MKFSFIYIFLLSLFYSQSSEFFIYGVGSSINNNDPGTISLGNSTFFSGNSKNISLSAPSSLWRSALTRFSIKTSINVNKDQEYPNYTQHSLTSFSLYFPIGNKKVFGFGIEPKYRLNNLTINDKDFKYLGSDVSGTGSPIAYKNTYTFNGGISALFIKYSQQIAEHFSAGIAYSLFFGSQQIIDDLYTYDIQLDTLNIGMNIDKYYSDLDTMYLYATNEMLTRANRYKKFSGSSVLFEGRFKNNKHECVASLALNGQFDVNTRNKQTSTNSYDEVQSYLTQYTNSSVNFINSADPSISELGFGYSYKINNMSGVVIESHLKSPMNIPDNAAIFNIMPPAENSLHFGFYNQVWNTKMGFWNTIIFRSGVYYKKLDFSGQKNIDYGFTLGAGIEYLSNTQSLDFALVFGKLDSKDINRNYSNYINIYIGFSTGEKWFMKRRRK